MLVMKCDHLGMTSNYGNRTITVNGKKQSGFHHGIDVIPKDKNNNKIADCDILCFADGEVTGVQKTGTQYGTMCYVRVKHNNGYYTYYCHQKTNTITVNKGDKVKKGDVLGKMGTTGNSNGTHLHFQIDKGSSSSSINPYDYLFNGKEFDTVAPNPTPSSSNSDTIYKVNKGDTLSGIAKRFGTTYQALAKYNSISNPNIIYVGQTIRIPASNSTTSTTPTSSTKVHKVVKGDTISGICKKYYGKYTSDLGNKIVNANKSKYPKITLNFIVVGWELVIPQ